MGTVVRDQTIAVLLLPAAAGQFLTAIARCRAAPTSRSHAAASAADELSAGGDAAEAEVGAAGAARAAGARARVVVGQRLVEVGQDHLLAGPEAGGDPGHHRAHRADLDLDRPGLAS